MDATGSQQQEKPAAERPADALKTFAATTSRLVKQAASILEEEIAAGIGAARQVEAKLLDVPKLRSGKPEEVMQRFRRDAHELVDIMLDVLQGAASALGSLAERAVKIRTEATPGGQMEPGKTATVELQQPVKAGERVEIPLTLANDSDSPTPEFTFFATDFVSQGGERIPADCAVFTPASLVIPPRSAEKVLLTLAVPEKTAPGTYSGLIQANKLGQLRAVIILRIE